MIYFLQNGDPTLVKIGYSNDAKRRTKDLQTGSPTKLTDLIPPIPGSKKREHWIHLKFDHLRVPGTKEWFRLDDDLRRFIFKFLGHDKYNEPLPLLEKIKTRTDLEENNATLILLQCADIIYEWDTRHGLWSWRLHMLRETLAASPLFESHEIKRSGNRKRDYDPSYLQDPNLPTNRYYKSKELNHT